MEYQQDFESILEAYPVRLDNFEGPLDLLLHLIKQHEVNIYDIPIAVVTEQYLDYIDLMQEMNLDVAGEFLVMAATLIHIKSRMLLPRADPAQEDPDEDPREALCAVCWSIRSSRRPPSCCTSAKRCAARSGRGPMVRSPKSPARRPSPKSRSISSA